MAENKEELSASEKAGMELAKAMYQSILESVIPQEVMEGVGKSIVAETPWTKLKPESKIALFRVASILQDKLPKNALATNAGESQLVTDSKPSE